MSLIDLVDDYNSCQPIKLSIEGYTIIVGNNAISSEEAMKKTLNDNESVYIMPILEGG